MYDLATSRNPNWPVQLLCDAVVENDRRRIILSSIVRVFNNTTLPLAVLKMDNNQPIKIATVDVNKDFYVPIDLLYAYSSAPVFISLDE